MFILKVHLFQIHLLKLSSFMFSLNSCSSTNAGFHGFAEWSRQWVKYVQLQRKLAERKWRLQSPEICRRKSSQICKYLVFVYVKTKKCIFLNWFRFSAMQSFQMIFVKSVSILCWDSLLFILQDGLEFPPRKKRGRKRKIDKLLEAAAAAAAAQQHAQQQAQLHAAEIMKAQQQAQDVMTSSSKHRYSPTPTPPPLASHSESGICSHLL